MVVWAWLDAFCVRVLAGVVAVWGVLGRGRRRWLFVLVARYSLDAGA